MNKVTHKFKLSKINQQYYLVEINNDVEFEIDDLRQLILFQKELGSEVLPVLVICPPNATTNNDLIKFISKNKNNPFSKADAFVLKSLSQKILANFYLKFAPPERPTQFFNEKEKALIWLSQYFNCLLFFPSICNFLLKKQDKKPRLLKIERLSKFYILL